MLQIILAILAFGVLVIVHEFGHFITAKRGGVQVNEFWIGMGPTLLKHEYHGTLYCLKLLPFGGACVMEGEDGESENEHAFGKAKLPRRMLIVCAGALMNFLVGFLIVLAVMQPNGPNGGYIVSTIASVDPASTAAGDLQAGEKTDYPLHLGVTEAGTEYMGTIKSAAGIGGLLALGVGDTIRVSLTDDPVKEVYAAKAILKAVGRAEEGINVVSCPTCGRTRINLIDIAKEVEQRCQSIRGKKMKVAVMGCVVNGPGEAREADLGIAGGDGVGLIFRRGEIIKKVPQEQLVDALMDEIAHYEGE